jgi:hypothetical protein
MKRLFALLLLAFAVSATVNQASAEVPWPICYPCGK